MFFKQDPEVEKVRLKTELRRLQEQKGAERARYEESKDLNTYKSQIQELKGSKFNPQKVEKVKSFLNSLKQGAMSLSQQQQKKQPSPTTKKSTPYNPFGGGGGFDIMQGGGKKQKNINPYNTNPMGGGFDIMQGGNSSPRKMRRKQSYNPNNWY